MARTQDVVSVAGAEMGPDAAPPERFFWDDAVPQLAERLRNGVRSWVVQTRVEGRTRRRTLGKVAEVPREVARDLARQTLEDLAAEPGTDPRQTIAAFAERFLADCAHQWKPSTLVGHRCCIDKQIVPWLGGVPVRAVDRAQVIRWQAEMTCAGGTKNRAMAVLSAMMRHAEVLGLRPAGSNPCAGLRRHQSGFKADYLDAAGFAALGRVLDAEARRFPRAVPFVRFVALTGCRKGEALNARWDHLDGCRIALPDAKSGPKAIWLGRPVQRLIAQLPCCGEGIFTGDDPTGLARDLKSLWPHVRKALNRPRFRLHDLRHSAASVAVNSGMSLQTIGGLLGHADLDSTAGYAHLDEARVSEASERVGRHLGRAFRKPRGRPKGSTMARRKAQLAEAARQEHAKRGEAQ